MNLQEETRDGYVISAQMKKVWAVQLDLLRKLLEVCEKNHLRIWADGGTLLGTVRHKGYIPWDDDIDLVMFREDYDRLVRLAPKEFNHPYFFQCGYTEKVYPRGHAQLRMDGTTAILLFPGFVNTHQGIFIDIFPYDAVPDDRSDMINQIKERNRLFDLMQQVASLDWFHPFRSLRLLWYRLGFAHLYKRYEDLFRQYKIDDCRNVSCFSFQVDPGRFLRDKHWYDGTLLMPFEEVMMPVPVGFHEILKKQYGDYMTPAKAPSYHGGFWKLDTDTGYEVYLPELKQYYCQMKKQRNKRRLSRLFTSLL